MKKLFTLLALSLIFLSSCEEDSLVVQNDIPPTDNIDVTLLPYYGESPVKYDSIYTNSQGIQFYIDSIGLLIDNVVFHPADSDEKVDTAKNWMHLDNTWPRGLGGLIPAGGYYGQFEISYGGDSVLADDLQKVLDINSNLVRNDGLGVNFFTIKGRIFDPSLPPTDSIFLPVQYTLGTHFLADTAVSETRYFSVDNSKNIAVFLLADVKPILHYVNLAVLQEVNSDFFDVQDWTIAEIMRDSLQIGVF